MGKCRCTDCGGDQPSHDRDCEYMNEHFGDEAYWNKKPDWNMMFLKVIISVLLLTVFCGVLFTIGKILLTTAYASVAPLGLVILMGGVIPLVIIWGLFHSLRFIWSSK